MIKDIHVNNFRLFADFHMSDLADVNLIAGKNNVGKSTLLDALHLLIKQDEHLRFCELIRRREEYAGRKYDVNHLFTGRHPNNGDQILISANQNPHSFNLTFVENEVPDWLDTEDDNDNMRRRDYPYYLEIDYGKNSKSRRVRLEDYGVLDRNAMGLRHSEDTNPSSYITTEGIDMRVLGRMWDKIGLSTERDYVLRMLNILDSNVSEIQFLTSGNGVRVKHNLFDMPIPLGSMGDGMNRILGIAMSMATLKNGYLIVDEIDTGLHYRTITDMWKLVITAAKELNVQVFATTHSQDCIVSFSEAMQELEDDESGAYFRLQRRGEKIQAVRYGADDLADALESSVEVR